VRYDFECLPAGFNQDTNNVSPRIGLAWSPSPQWVFRAGYGVFFDRYVLTNLTRAIEKSFALARVIASEYQSKPVQVAAYAFALAISASRVTARQHFPSDVLVRRRLRVFKSAGTWSDITQRKALIRGFLLFL